MEENAGDESVMGVEYYIIKPSTKEMFYLGKDLWYLMEGLSCTKPAEPEYEDWKEVLCDIIQAGCYTCEDTMEYMQELAIKIWDFIQYEKVQLVSDCQEDTSWLNEYKEVEDIIEITRSIYGG